MSDQDEALVYPCAMFGLGIGQDYSTDPAVSASYSARSRQILSELTIETGD